MAADRKASPSPAPLEWATAALGAVLLLAALAFLVHEAMVPATPPQPVISVLGIEAQQGRYLVHLRVENRGDRTAAQLRVRATLSADQGVVEEAETEFDFLPGRSRREAGLFFGRDPRAYRMEIAPRSYQQP